MVLQLTNTLSRKKEIFVPWASDRASLYVCGITPYDFAHIGHGRCYVVFDILNRVLREAGYPVVYCRNFTDIDDKLLARAEREYGDPSRYREIADRFIASFHEDVAALGCLKPEFEPRVTEFITQIISFIEELEKRGFAYAVNGSVYFSVAKMADYGRLSGRNVDELLAGARVEVNPEKRDPLDFALWKAEEGKEFWQSPWGHGRPGWHIECSVMARVLLGDHFDIHGGGMDLIFPHHENEMAQSEALLGPDYVHYWVHNAFVRIDKEKMSKSLGNFFTLRQVFEKYDPMVVRFMILGHHYRSPLDFSFSDLDAAQRSYQRLARAFVDVQPLLSGFSSHPVVQQACDFVADDLNTPGALGVVFENLASLDETGKAAMKGFLLQLLGLALIPLPEKEVEITAQVQQLIDEREEARKARDWKRADELRDRLQELGYTVHDKKL
ncbi:MAG: cysteine--tRNA ligase [Candidatus Dependentiae bacterium]|nr:cysteine--tRNA ligase [Candidatus Dependentiae bacterium]